jgi:hypothetical protein
MVRDRNAQTPGSVDMLRFGLLIALVLIAGANTSALAQDVPGIELCTRENNIDRRTGCLQSNVEYLQKLMAKNAAAAQQRLDAANAEIAALKSALANLRASVDKLQPSAGKPEAK